MSMDSIQISTQKIFLNFTLGKGVLQSIYPLYFALLASFAILSEKWVNSLLLVVLYPIRWSHEARKKWKSCEKNRFSSSKFFVDIKLFVLHFLIFFSINETY